MNREKLANEIGDLLNLPREGRQGKAYKIINTIIDTMIKALRSGDSIRIDGFGIFKTYERPATRHGVYFYPYLKRKGLHTEVKEFPPTKRIIFKPSKALTKIVNLAEPNGN